MQILHSRVPLTPGYMYSLNQYCEIVAAAVVVVVVLVEVGVSSSSSSSSSP